VSTTGYIYIGRRLVSEKRRPKEESIIGEVIMKKRRKEGGLDQGREVRVWTQQEVGSKRGVASMGKLCPK